MTRQENDLHDSIVEFAKDFLNHKVIDRDKNQVFDKSIWNKCGEHLLQGLVVDKEYGGLGLNIRSTIIALEALGYGCTDNGLTFAIGAHLLACVVPIWLYGREDQKNVLLPSLCNGEFIAANAISESKSGSDAFNMESSAVSTQGGYILNGRKKYCSNGPVADIVIAYVATDKKKGMLGGISSFILKKFEHEFLVSQKVDKMGLRSCHMGDIVLEDIPVSNIDLLGKEGGGAMIFNKSMVWERIGLSAIHIGTLHRIFEDAIKYVNSRKSFGFSLSKYQAISHKLVDIYSEIESVRLLLNKAISSLQDNSSTDLIASLLKMKTSELYKYATLELIQIYGAIGYINNHEIERMHRDAVASTLYSGSSEIQKNLIAKRIGLK